MYEAHFGLNQPPFSLSPDTALFVRLDDHEACYQLLTHVLNTGEGFLKVIGDVGTGKTILCRRLLRYLSDDHLAAERFHSVYLPNPMLSPVGLYRAVGQELGLSVPMKTDNAALLEQINQQILNLAQQQRGVVVVVDEAQSLPENTLEALRLITNLETEQQKLVQVILFGQPELDDLLNQNRFRQLRQRITFAHYLQPLSRTAMRQYLDFRLTHSGYNGPSLISDRTLKRLHRLSGGVPRMINVLTHKALLSAFADKRFQLSPGDVDRAWRDSRPRINSRRPWLAPVLAGAAVSLLAMITVWSLL